MIRICLFLFITFLTLNLTSIGYASSVGIVATVGDQAISSSDVEDRMKLATFASGLPITPETTEKLLPQILQLLIDEQLYRQHASQLKIEIEKDEMDRALANLAKQNNLPPAQLEGFLEEHGVPMRALKHQVEAEILWQKIILNKIRPKILITDREVDEGIEYISQHESSAGEVSLSEITIPVSSPQDENSVAELTKKLVKEIRDGADFASVARQFSRSTTATSGGTIGWISQNQLSPDIFNAIRNLDKGMVSDPVRTPDGYHIFRLDDRRAVIKAASGDAEYGIRQAFVEFPPSITEKEEAAFIQKISVEKNKVNTCSSFEAFAASVHSLLPPKLMMVQLKQLNSKIAEVIMATEMGKTSAIVKSDSGIHIFMVCEKTEPQLSLATRNKVRDVLYRQKLELGIRRYLQDLRQNTFVEIRKP